MTISWRIHKFIQNSKVGTGANLLAKHNRGVYQWNNTNKLDLFSGVSQYADSFAKLPGGGKIRVLLSWLHKIELKYVQIVKAEGI